MSSMNFNPSVRRSPFGVFVYLHVECGDEGTAYPVSDESLQKLADQLWDLGVKPSAAKAVAEAKPAESQMLRARFRDESSGLAPVLEVMARVIEKMIEADITRLIAEKQAK